MSSLGERVPAAADSLAIGRDLPRHRARRPRSEQALIRGILAGSEADLEALFRRYWPRAYRTAFLIVHDHAASETHRVVDELMRPEQEPLRTTRGDVDQKRLRCEVGRRLRLEIAKLEADEIFRDLIGFGAGTDKTCLEQPRPGSPMSQRRISRSWREACPANFPTRMRSALFCVPHSPPGRGKVWRGGFN